MSQERETVTVDVVAERLGEAERLLREATLRVQDLTATATVASQSAGSVATAAAALERSASDMSKTAASLDNARGALVAAMEAARDFLASTDVSAVASSLTQLESRVDSLVVAAESGAVADREFQSELRATLDRVRELETERDSYRTRLDAVMAQIPARVAKKIT